MIETAEGAVQVAEPAADPLTPGAFLGGWRLMAFDGFEWDVPDTKANAARSAMPGPALTRTRCGRYEHLATELDKRFGPLAQLPVRVEVRHGEAGRSTETVLDELGSWGNPILAIFDSWGNVNVPLNLVARVAHNPSSEVITTFGPNWFSRRERMDPDQLDEVFGGRQHWERADREGRPDERWRVWLSNYREALRRAGFRYRLQFEVVPKTGQPLYLVYGTGHVWSSASSRAYHPGGARAVAAA